MTVSLVSTELKDEEATTGVLARAREVVDIEIEGLNALKSQLDEGFIEAVRQIEACKGRVIITGMGKSGHIGKKIAATLSSTGTPALFLHPAEGSHGDLGAVTKEDIVIAISNSGETPEILQVLPLVKRFGLPLIAMTGKPESTLAERSNAVLNVAVPKEACPLALAPTSSTTATLAMGDALSVVLMERKGFTEEDFALFHPAGSLGKRLLLKVSDVMHSGESVPVVLKDAPFLDALMETTSKKLGFTLVVDDNGKLLGMLTDGDVRRALTKHGDVRQVKVLDCLTPQPKSIAPDALAVTALRMMEESKITALVMLDDCGVPQGVVHMHDILRTGIS